MKLTLSINKTVEQNASVYYDKVKKAKKKITGAKEALMHTKKKLEKIDIVEIKKPKRKNNKKEWFEKFRWFISSEGLLVIGGRDSTSNEIIIKKYTEANDIVLHTDMAGSPFFVIKTNGQKADSTLKEAADATASYSRGWKMGLASQEVFYVKPSQISKAAKAGESLPKGAFMITGETKYVKNKMRIAIGMLDGNIIGGPTEAIMSHTKNFVIIKQGDNKPSDIARKVVKLIGGHVDDVIKFLPAGGCSIETSKKR